MFCYFYLQEIELFNEVKDLFLFVILMELVYFLLSLFIFDLRESVIEQDELLLFIELLINDVDVYKLVGEILSEVSWSVCDNLIVFERFF